MKKNLMYTFALAAMVFATSCDQNTTATDAVVTENQTTEADVQPVSNPNVATTENVATSENAAVMTFKETEYDFGTIKQGDVVDHTFTFTNTGNSPLVIESASASCGCTAPDWTKTPVAPGEQGQVKVQFNSTGKVGQQSPMVTIRANTEPNIVRVSMKGEVKSNNVPTAGTQGPVKQ
jgi:hypothetical protein